MSGILLAIERKTAIAFAEPGGPEGIADESTPGAEAQY
jgi:hypothetical protein